MRRVVIGLLLLLTACGSPVAEKANQGNARFDEGDYEAALRAYQAAQVAAPDRPEGYFNAANALFGLVEVERALAALEQALRTADDDLAVDAYYNMGNIYYEIGFYDLAVEFYQNALLLDPEDSDVRFNLELALLRQRVPTPTAIEQQTEPDQQQTDPEVTPTSQPGAFDGPTPTPPPSAPDLTATPETDGSDSDESEESESPVPQSDGDMTVEEAERLLDQVQQNQEALREYLEEKGGAGQPREKDW